jgi:hypothetical protein
MAKRGREGELFIIWAKKAKGSPYQTSSCKDLPEAKREIKHMIKEGFFLAVITKYISGSMEEL